MEKVLGLTPNEWAAVEAMGSVLGAFGTLVAVFIALWLAQRDNRPLLSVHSAIMHAVERSGSFRPPNAIRIPVELVAIKGTNAGRVPIVVKGVFWTIGWLRKETLMGFAPENPYSDGLPQEISYAGQVFVGIPISDFESNLPTFFRCLDGMRFPILQIHSLRSGMFTSVGKDFSTRADPRIRKLIRQKYQEYLATKGSDQAKH